MAYKILGSDGRAFDGSTAGLREVGGGKTKLLRQYADGILAVTHKNQITAHDDKNCTGTAVGKGIVDNYVTSAFFKLIEARGVQTAHQMVYSPDTTLEEELDMMPFEIIWRRVNVKDNSWAKRHPGEVAEGATFNQIIFEACLKWSVRDKTGELIHDPFLILDENFKPQLRADGMPRLMHSKKPGVEVDYDNVLEPGSGDNIPFDDVREAMIDFDEEAEGILHDTNIVQQTAFETYAEMGELNCDGKVEYGKRKSGSKKGQRILGDSLDFDSVRNVSPHTIVVAGQEYTFDDPTLGKDLNQLIHDGPAQLEKIIKAHHSTKQRFRNLVTPWREHEISERRQRANDAAAEEVTEKFYFPGALALSGVVGKRVGYILKAA